VTPVVIAIVVAMVAIILVLLLVYLRRKQLLIVRSGKGMSVRKLLKSRKGPGSDFDGANIEGDEDPDHVAEDISVNPLYGDMSNPDVIAMDWIQSSGDRPTSLTMKSVTNPNYESTIEGGAQRERVASNPIYQTTAEYEGENPLYETGAGVSERGISNADVNPLYEPGPVVRGGSGGMADLNPLYQSTASYHSQSDVNPLYEGASDVIPLYESAAADEEPSFDLNRGKVRRRVDSRSKKDGKQRKEDELPIMEGASMYWSGHDEALGVINRGADVTFNELYGSVEQPDSSPLECEPEAPPVPPRQHPKHS